MTNLEISLPCTYKLDESLEEFKLDESLEEFDSLHILIICFFLNFIVSLLYFNKEYLVLFQLRIYVSD